MNPIAERCAPFDDDLSALLDGQLDAPRAAEVRAHAESCRDCAQRLEALRGVDVVLRRVAAAPVDAIRTARMRSALAAKLRAEANRAAQGTPPLRRTPPRQRRWLAPAGFAAMAATAAALLVVMRTQSPVAPTAEHVVVAERVAPKLRADAEAAARELTVRRDAPLGANTPPSAEVAPPPGRRDEALDPAAALAKLSPEARQRLRERLGTMQPAERSQLLERLARLPELSPGERSEVAETLARLGVVTPEERARILSQRETQQ